MMALYDFGYAYIESPLYGMSPQMVAHLSLYSVKNWNNKHIGLPRS